MSAASDEEARPGPARPTPYQGLVPYSEEDAAYFFGRDTAREIVLDNLLAYRMSVLYGPSGVGKSSLLRAGVARHVRDAGLRQIERGEPAEYAAVVFGSWSEDPVVGLKRAIAAALAQLSPSLATGLPDGSLAEVVSAAAQRLDGSLLIVLDQFEEYFLYHAADGPFIAELRRTIARRDAAASVLVSIREDALAALDGLDAELPGLLDHLIRVEHLDRDAAREAIEKPLKLWNGEQARPGEEVRIEPALVEAVLDGVQARRVDPSELGGAGGTGSDRSDMRIQTPYLQLVLTRLWEEERRAGSRVLRSQTLERLGGPQQIVATHVDMAIASLSPPEQAVAASVLRQLVTPSGTKIALRASDLADYAEIDASTVTGVLERLTRESRILQAVGESRYEIYHDALARPILDWRRRWQERQDRARRQRRTTIAALIGGGLLATVVVVAVLAVLAIQGRQDARRQAADASSVALASAAADVVDSQPDASLLLALAALRRKDRPEARDEMIGARLAANPADGTRGILRGHAGNGVGVAFVRGGRTIASAGDDGRVLLWDARTHRRLGGPLARGPRTGPLTSLAVSRDGDTLAVGAQDGRIELWALASRRALGVLESGRRPVYSVAFSYDGHTLATAGEGRRIRLWDVRSLQPRGRPIVVADRVTSSVAFSPDGRTIAAVGGLYRVRLWDVRSRQARGRAFGGGSAPLTSVAFSPDGRTIAVGGARSWLWEPGSGRRRLLDAGQPLYSVAFSPDGRRIACVGEHGAVGVWSTASQRWLDRPIAGLSSSLTSVAFSPDGTMLAAAGDGKPVWLFDAAGSQTLERHRDTVNDVAFDRAGRMVATAGYDARIWLWDARSRRTVGSPLQGDAPFNSAAFGPDGRTLASGGDDMQVRIWDLASRRVAARLSGHTDGVNAVAFDRTGELLASGSGDGTIILWDARSRRRLGEPLRAHEGGVNALAFSPDGRILASGGVDGRVRLWDPSTRRPLGAALARHEDMVNDVAFSPNGRTLASAGTDETIRLWDGRAGRARGSLRAGDAVLSVAFAADGRTLIAGARGVQLWDVVARRRLGDSLIGHESSVTAVAASPDGRAFASAGTDATARLWPHLIWPDLPTLTREICALVGEGLSPTEWERHAAGISYQPLCEP